MIIRGKSPLRISLAGGGTDLNYIFEKYGGAVVNFTIDKFCHMSLEKRKDKLIFINGELLDKEEKLAYRVINYFEPNFGFNLIYWNDIPPGSGLGSSSSFVVLLLTILYEAKGIVKSDEEIVKEAFKIENTIKEGGWQDQYATSIGGFNFMEFGEKTIVYPLRLRYRYLQELTEHLVLVPIGGTKEHDIHKEMRKYEQSHEEAINRTRSIKELAFEARDCLLNQKVNEVGKILWKNWELKRNKFTSNERIEEIYNLALENGATGGKLCGSGQAGHMLFFVPPEKRESFKKAIKLPLISFNFTKHGTETWRINE